MVACDEDANKFPYAAKIVLVSDSKEDCYKSKAATEKLRSSQDQKNEKKMKGKSKQSQEDKYLNLKPSKIAKIVDDHDQDVYVADKLVYPLPKHNCQMNLNLKVCHSDTEFDMDVDDEFKPSDSEHYASDTESLVTPSPKKMRKGKKKVKARKMQFPLKNRNPLSLPKRSKKPMNKNNHD